MKKAQILAFLLLILMSLNSCQKTRRNADLKSISKFTWYLVSWEGNKVDKKLYPESLPLINFTTEGKFSGHTGCNRFSTTIIIEDLDITLLGGYLTQKGCPNDRAEVEDKMMEGINLSNRLYQEDFFLIFMQDDKELLRFKK